MSLDHWLVRQTTRPSFVHWVERFSRRMPVRQGPLQRAEVSLTFDDGPHPRWTPAILDALERADAKATFFVVGQAVDAHPEIVLETRRRGHEIGTHLYSHERAVSLDPRRFDDELSKSRQQLEALLGEPLRWLRFPYGEPGGQDPRTVERVHGVRAVHWTYSSHDSRARHATDVSERVRAGLRAGAIILLHDALFDADRVSAPYVADRSATLAAIPAIAELLNQHKLRAVTLSELFRTA